MDGWKTGKNMPFLLVVLSIFLSIYLSIYIYICFFFRGCGIRSTFVFFIKDFAVGPAKDMTKKDCCNLDR